MGQYSLTAVGPEAKANRRAHFGDRATAHWPRATAVAADRRESRAIRNFRVFSHDDDAKKKRCLSPSRRPRHTPSMVDGLAIGTGWCKCKSLVSGVMVFGRGGNDGSVVTPMNGSKIGVTSTRKWPESQEKRAFRRMESDNRFCLGRSPQLGFTHELSRLHVKISPLGLTLNSGKLSYQVAGSLQLAAVICDHRAAPR